MLCGDFTGIFSRHRERLSFVRVPQCGRFHDQLLLRIQAHRSSCATSMPHTPHNVGCSICDEGWWLALVDLANCRPTGILHFVPTTPNFSALCVDTAIIVVSECFAATPRPDVRSMGDGITIADECSWPLVVRVCVSWRRQLGSACKK